MLESGVYSTADEASEVSLANQCVPTADCTLPQVDGHEEYTNLEHPQQTSCQGIKLQ